MLDFSLFCFLSYLPPLHLFSSLSVSCNSLFSCLDDGFSTFSTLRLRSVGFHTKILVNIFRIIATNRKPNLKSLFRCSNINFSHDSRLLKNVTCKNRISPKKIKIRSFKENSELKFGVSMKTP